MKYDNTNRGALFRNDDKTDDKHADYRGNVNVEGTEYWINAWISESKKGTKYMALRLKKRAAAKAGDAKASAGIDYRR
ncbi:MAG: hypothetical protein WBG18_18130 [Xanthobacteraceae bacterium]